MSVRTLNRSLEMNAGSNQFLTTYLTLIVILVGIFVYLSSSSEIDLLAAATRSPSNDVTATSNVPVPLWSYRIPLSQLFVSETIIAEEIQPLLRSLSLFTHAYGLTLVGRIQSAPSSEPSNLDARGLRQASLLWQYFAQHGLSRQNSFFYFTATPSRWTPAHLLISIYKTYPSTIYPL